MTFLKFMQLVFVLLLISLALLILKYFKVQCKTWKSNCIKKIQTCFYKLAIWSFPIKYLFQNYLILLASMIFEVQETKFRRNLLSNESIQTIVGILLLFLISITIFYLLIVCFIKFFKIQKSDSQFISLIEGLNKTSWIWTMMYYFHFISARLIVTLFLGLTPFGNSLMFWSILILIQIIFILINLFKIYPQISLRIISLLTEFLVLGVILFCFTCHFYNESSNETKIQQASIFAYFYVSYNFLICFLTLMMMLI